jgi:hypothetical protein
MQNRVQLEVRVLACHEWAYAVSAGASPAAPLKAMSQLIFIHAGWTPALQVWPVKICILKTG